MSKTVSTCLLETNQVQGQPQENVFFHSLYRTEPEFISEYLRTARSTSPIQICAIFSTSGPDNLSAMLNIELCKTLGSIVDKVQKQPVLDFNKFSNDVVTTLNNKVCNYIVSKGGTPLKTSMTMMIVEGDILRIIHIGNTKAVLFRDKKIMALTEEQTVAHRYVQMGAITAEQEKTHPEKDVLTQYLGKMPQDGELVPEKKVNIKLKDNDEIYLMGLGISKAIPQQMRNMVICKDMDTEDKSRDIVISAINYGVKYGLSMVAMKIESTFLLPGDAVIASNIPDNQLSTDVKPQEDDDPYVPFNDPKNSDFDDSDDDMGNTATFTYGKESSSDDKKKDDKKKDGKGGSGSKDSSKDGSKDKSKDKSKDDSNNDPKAKKKTVLIDIGIVLGILLVFAGIAFGISYMVMKKYGWISAETTTMPTMITTTHGTDAVEIDTNAYYDEAHLLYAINDNVKIYQFNDQTSEILKDLKVNDEVIVIGEDETGLYYLIEFNGENAYVLKPLVSEYETVESAPSTVETAQTSLPRGGEPTVQQSPATAATTAATEPTETTAQTAATETAPATTETTASTDATEATDPATGETTEAQNTDATDAQNTDATEAPSTDATETTAAETTAAPTEPVATETTAAPTEAPATEAPAQTEAPATEAAPAATEAAPAEA